MISDTYFEISKQFQIFLLLFFLFVHYTISCYIMRTFKRLLCKVTVRQSTQPWWCVPCRY